MEKVVSIINPKAGGFNEFVETCTYYNLNKMFSDYELIKTSQVQSGIAEKNVNTNLEQIIRDFSFNGVRHFNIGGGDGTIGEVVHAIMNTGINTKEFTLSVLPIGSANDLANWGLGIKGMSDGFEAMRDYYEKGLDNFKDVDVFRVKMELDNGTEFSRYGINSADVSFGAFLLNFMENTKLGIKIKKKLKDKSYTFLSPLVSLLYNSPDLRIDVNGQTKVESCKKNFLSCWQNSERTGGGLRFCPGAEIDDGKFNFFIHERAYRAKFPLILMLKAKKGEDIKDPYVDKVGGVDNVEISANSKNLGRYLNVDGELYTFQSSIKKVTYEGIDKELRFLCNK